MDRVLTEKERFVTVFMSCTDYIKTPHGLFQRIINQAESFLELSDLSSQNKVIKKEISHKLKLKFYEGKTKKIFEIKGNVQYSDLNIDEKLFAVLETIHIETQRPVLVIIDELDRVENTSGLASFIKNHCNDWLKIVIVGISNNISALIHDHESITRKLIPVKINTMSRDELSSILGKTENFLMDNELKYSFDGEAKKLIVDSADGYPWFVHTFGQEALVSAYDNNDSIININYIKEVIDDLANNRFARHFADSYQHAVKDSQQREVVLRLFSKWGNNDIPQAELYPLAKEAGVKNPSSLKKHLTQKKWGAILVNPPHAGAGTIRFKNTMFKRYIDIRPSIYNGVKNTVDELWNKRIKDMQ